MFRSTPSLVAVISVTALFTCAAIAAADPGEEHGHDGIPVPAPTLPLTPPGSSNLTFLSAADNDGTTNSDIAFYGTKAYVGYYGPSPTIPASRPTRRP